MQSPNNEKYHLSVVMNEFEELKCPQTIRCYFDPEMLVQDAIDKISKRGNVQIQANSTEEYLLFPNPTSSLKLSIKTKHALDLDRPLKSFAKSGETLLLKKVKKERIRIEALVEDYVELQTAKSVAQMFSKSDTPSDVIHYIANKGGLKVAEDEAHCALFLPTPKSRKGVYMEPHKPLRTFPSHGEVMTVIFRHRKLDERVINVEIPNFEDLKCQKRVRMRININITVEEALIKVKQKIFYEDVTRYMLTFQGERLKSTHTLAYYGVQEQDVLFFEKRTMFSTSPLWRQARNENAVILCERDKDEPMNRETIRFVSAEHAKFYYSLSLENFSKSETSETISPMFRGDSFDNLSMGSHDSDSTPNESENEFTSSSDFSEPEPKVERKIEESSPETKAVEPIMPRADSIKKIILSPDSTPPSSPTPETPTRRRNVNRGKLGAISPRVPRKDQSLRLISVYFTNTKFYTIAINTACTAKDISSGIAENYRSYGLSLPQVTLRVAEKTDKGIELKGDELDVDVNISNLKSEYDWTPSTILYAKLKFPENFGENSENSSPRSSPVKRNSNPSPGPRRSSLGLTPSAKVKNRGTADSIKAIVIGGDAVESGSENGDDRSQGDDDDYWLDSKLVQREKKLSKGAFAKVYLGKYKDEVVAIKSLIGEMDEDQIQSFRLEVDILSHLRSPYLVKFVGAFVEGENKLSMVMEFCEHQSVYDNLIRKDFEFSWKTLLRWMEQACIGLRVLHTSDPPLVHRDIKSLNLLLDKHWNVKVCDFGLSRSAVALNAHTLGQVRGTMAYSPPEVFAGASFTPKSDIYSIGMVLWEMASRMVRGEYRKPFSEFEEISYDFQIIQQASESNLRPTIPEGTPKVIESLIVECWHRDPQKRPSTQGLLTKLNYLREEYERDSECLFTLM